MKTALFLTIAFCSLGPGAFAWTPSSSSSSTSTSNTRASRRAFFGKAAASVAPLVLVAGFPGAATADDEAVATSAEAPAPVSSETAASAPAAVAEATPAVLEETATSEPPVDEAKEGDAAPGLAEEEENEFIARLVARSEANRDKYKAMAESNDKLSHRQFLSQYDRPSYVGVYERDAGTSTMFLKEDFEKMVDEGKVVQAYMSKVSKKTGEISDDYARPIFVFAN